METSSRVDEIKTCPFSQRFTGWLSAGVPAVEKKKIDKSSAAAWKHNWVDGGKINI